MTGTTTPRRIAALIALVAALIAPAAPVGADDLSALPRVDEHVGARVPLDLPFTDTAGRAVTLRDVLAGPRPALLVMAYARCTMLCSVVLRGVADVARRSSLVVGRDYTLLVVSLDPRETVADALARQAALLDALGRPGERALWPYLVGDRASVQRLADALGFRYRWDARTQQYDHPAVVFVLTPDGRIAHYLYDLRQDPRELELALRVAADGRTLEREAAAALRCFHFDPALRRYGARIERFLRIGGALVFAALLATVTSLILWERRRSRWTS